MLHSHLPGSARTRRRTWSSGQKSTSLGWTAASSTVRPTRPLNSLSPPRFCRQLTPCRSTVGTGNGQLLFAFSAAGYTSLTGVDYSPLSIQLAESVLAARLASDEHPVSSPPPAFYTADILDVALGETVPHVTDSEEKWDLVTDKGTYDAVCLSDELRRGRSLRELYVESVSKLLQPGGLFLITSCASSSFLPFLGRSTTSSSSRPARRQLDPGRAREGVRHSRNRCVSLSWLARPHQATRTDPLLATTGLTVHSHVPRASFQFGGSTGSSITTVAFEKQ